jgi:hypothetical protein
VDVPPNLQVDVPERRSEPPCGLVEPQRYKVQFTASEEYVRLVDEAKALLSHAASRVTLEEVHLRAMRAFVSELAKKKYAAGGRARVRHKDDRATRPVNNAVDSRGAEHVGAARVGIEHVGAERMASRAAGDDARALGSSLCAEDPLGACAAKHDGDMAQVCPRGRHVPADVRRVVAERDGRRCSYVDSAGRRCSETHWLEFHHLNPFALGGEHAAANLTLRCAAHNALAAEEDFGRELIHARAHTGRHEPLTGQELQPNFRHV